VEVIETNHDPLQQFVPHVMCCGKFGLLLLCPDDALCFSSDSETNGLFRLKRVR
jgi:hypothetical protein